MELLSMKRKMELLHNSMWKCFKKTRLVSFRDVKLPVVFALMSPGITSLWFGMKQPRNPNFVIVVNSQKCKYSIFWRTCLLTTGEKVFSVPGLFICFVVVYSQSSVSYFYGFPISQRKQQCPTCWTNSFVCLKPQKRRVHHWFGSTSSDSFLFNCLLIFF